MNHMLTNVMNHMLTNVQLTLSEYLVYTIAFDLLLFAMYVEISPVF